ncbi:hypothetical protein [Sphingomonas japonica]|uniref:Invasion protein IalB, involved in pathogenesis n=1 Tax=Sphingomonas japonica TaxID=511662 RepID=A0ABX0U2W7_9SPHN|nr:hypothetical protein [Sphingomonas japonica]NIJ23117.1 hypothetical protein [Sphingomonas japonica]
MIAALLALAAAVPQAAGARDAIGVYDRWGAFRDRSPRRCYAISQPVRTGRGATQAPFASIGSWPGAGLGNQLHVRLSRERNAGARVTLSIGERRFRLIAGSVDAWSPDAATDRAIVAAMRSGRSMSIETLAQSGRAFADVYALSGAATAIDAAGIACAQRR